MKNSITLLASCFFCIINITAQELPCTLSPSLSSDWSCLGPFEYEESKQGKIVAIWADPGSINTLYAGTGSSGLWKTSDGGSNWENLFSFELAGVGVQEIEQAEVFVEGPSFTTYAIYGSTMFEGSNMSRFGIGLVYYEPFNGTWQKEAESNFPVGFSFELHKDYFGGFALAYQQGLKKLWVGNSKKIFIRNTYRNYAAPHYTWLPDPVFDFAIHGDATGSKQSVREIDFAPADNSIVVISPNGGRQYDFLISLNASSAVPTWQSLPLPPFPLTTPAGTGDYFRFEATTFFLDNDIFYSVFKVAVFTNVSDDYPIYTSCYLGLYDLSGPSPVLTKYHQLINNTLSNSLGDRPRGGFTDLIVFPDNDDEFFVGDNQDGLQKGVIPLSGDINMFRVSTLNPGFEIENTHTDIRSMDFYYSSPSSKIIYIATDGGVSKCDNVSALLNSDDANDDIWQNINGYGFTMTEFVGFSNSEFDKYRIIAAAPDGNSFIYKNDGTDNYQFYSLSRGDAYNASLSKTNFDKAIHNSNGGGPDLASEFNRVDLNAVSWSSPGISEIPRADPDPECTPAECANGTCPNVDECLEYNIGLKPFDFEIDLGQEFLWVGTDDLFRNPKALTTPYLQSDYEQMSKAHVSNDDNPLVAASDKTTRAITSYKRVDRSAGDDIIIDMYFTTQKEWQPTNPGYPDAVKIVKATYNETFADPYDAFSITPLTIIDEAPGYSHFDYAYITDIEVDASDPDASNTEIWVCFGANFQGENLLATALGPDNNGIKAKVYYSPDDGETWFNRSAGLPDYPVICLEYWKGSDDIIFAGTNVGVYIWNKAEEIWECFNTDNQMPYASVNDLEINYCTMSLRACTQGYALWETPLPLGTHFSRAGAPALEITSDITWTQSNDAGRDIRIKPGATLTIQNCEIRMPKEHRIIVERGAALILDNATLINHCEVWGGIEVWGNTAKPHPLVTNVLNGTYPSALDDQGVVYLKNNSKIINAETGISTYKTTPEGNDAAYNGGIIIAEDASFINNQLAVRFMPYDYPVAGAYDTDDDNISYFKNCVFNINTEYILENNSAYQIYMWDVDGIKFLGCDFSNGLLQADVTQRGEAIYSVDATYTVSNYCTDIYAPCGHYDNSQFSGFFRAIEAANTKYLPLDITITYNLFENNQRGVLLSNVDNSSVFLNSYMVPDHATNHNYGVYLEQSEGYRVEENTFTGYESLSGTAPYSTGLYVGNNSNAVTKIYKNYFNNLETGIRSQTLNKKLQIKCCTFNAIAFFNLYVTSGELDNQGKCLNASYPLSERVQSPAGNVFSHEVNPNGDIKVLSAADPFIYRHHIDLAPQYYSSSKVTLDQCNVYTTQGEACPSYIDGSGTAEEMMSMAEEIQDVIDVITSEIDAIAFSESEFTVEELEEDLSIFESEKEYYTTEAVDLYITEQKPDSAIAVLQNEEAQWAQQRLVEVYMLTGDYESANTQLKTLPTDELATQDFVSLMEVMINMQSNERTLDSLTEKEFAIIESLQGKQSPSGIAAENILQLINKIDIPEVFDAEEAEEDMRYANTEITSAIKIFPNPTDNELFIDLTAITETQIPIRIVIYNLIGNKILEQELFGGEIQKIPLQNFSTGIYLLQCYQENVVLHVEKVVVE